MTLTLQPQMTIGQGRYRLLRHISRGGQADVWEAEQAGIAGFRKTIVLKVLRSDQDFSDEAKEVLLQEARLATQLKHPNIIEIYDVGQEGDLVYIAMESIEGCDLNTLFTRCMTHWKRPLPWGLAVRFATRIARALEHAHQKTDATGQLLEIVHRDLKPANILIAKEGFIKLIDFGIAKSYQIESKKSGILKGTAAYMSPEQVLGERLDGRSDLFSLGSLLYEMCTGVRPFEPKEGGMGAQIFAVVEANPPSLREISPALPEGLEQIISKLMKKAREERFPDARAAYRALDQLLREQQIFLEQEDVADFYRDLIDKEAIRGERFIPPEGRGYLQGTLPPSEPPPPAPEDDWESRTQIGASWQPESATLKTPKEPPHPQHSLAVPLFADHEAPPLFDNERESSEELPDWSQTQQHIPPAETRHRPPLNDKTVVEMPSFGEMQALQPPPQWQKENASARSALPANYLPPPPSPLVPPPSSPQISPHAAAYLTPTTSALSPHSLDGSNDALPTRSPLSTRDLPNFKDNEDTTEPLTAAINHTISSPGQRTPTAFRSDDLQHLAPKKRRRFPWLLALVVITASIGAIWFLVQ